MFTLKTQSIFKRFQGEHIISCPFCLFGSLILYSYFTAPIKSVTFST